MKTGLFLFLLAVAAMALGDEQPLQVEIECQFVEFEGSVVEKLAIKQAITADSLTEVWAAGKGKLIAAPRVITRSGSEATIRGVRELIYPTEFTVSQPGESNAVVDATGTVAVPQSFETREVGSILSVIPEVAPDRVFINLNLRPEWVDFAEWENYGMEIADRTGGVRSLSMRQPIFYRTSVETQVSITSGKRIMIGGGVPGKKEGTLIYTFISCRLVDLEGKPLPSLAETISGAGK